MSCRFVREGIVLKGPTPKTAAFAHKIHGAMFSNYVTHFRQHKQAKRFVTDPM